MHTDIIYYTLTPNWSLSDFLQLCEKVRKEWMQDQKGFVSWIQYRNSKGGFTDIVEWESKGMMKLAEAQMKYNRYKVEWESCYQVEKSESLESIV